MWRLLKKILRRSVVPGIIAFEVFVIYQTTQSLSYKCPDKEAKHILQNLCELYKKNAVDGNLCADLCDTGALHYVSCFNYHRGKAVFSAMWNEVPVILKSKYGHLSNYSRPFATVLDGEGIARTAAPDVELFTSMVYHQVQGQFGFDLRLTKKEVLGRMWPGQGAGRKEDDGIVSLTDAEVTSLWSLLQQEEFVIFQFWSGFRHYPKMYGTCGHFYALENVPPGFILNPSAISMQEQLASLPWLNRAKIALSILDLVAALDSKFPEKLHLCDVKHDNYGVSTELIVKAIDVDIAFFQNQLDMTLNQPKCTTDEECHFFDCKGSCNVSTGKCNRQRANTNLQAICADVFSRHYGTQGLLRLPPTKVARQLDAVLQDCIQQKGLPVDTRISQTAVFQTLQDLLEASLKYVQVDR